MNVVYLAASTPASTDMVDIILLADDADRDGDRGEEEADERPAIARKKPPRLAAVRVVMPSTDAAPTTTPNRLVLSPLLLHMAGRTWQTPRGQNRLLNTWLKEHGKL